MVYNYINSATVIFDVFDQYNIKSEEFIQRTPNWILRCLQEIQAYHVYVDRFVEGELKNNRFYLPEEFKKVRNVWIDGQAAIQYNGFRDGMDVDCNPSQVMKFTDVTVIPADKSNSDDRRSDDCGCVYPEPVDKSSFPRWVYNPFGGADLMRWLNPARAACSDAPQNVDELPSSPRFTIENGWIKTDRGSKITLLYAALPMDYDEVNQMWFPLIPDNEDVRKAVGAYVMMRLLMRGYIHPILNLRDNNPFTNPGIAYKEAALKARMSCMAMNLPQRKNLTREMNIKFGNTFANGRSQGIKS